MSHAPNNPSAPSVERTPEPAAPVGALDLGTGSASLTCDNAVEESVELRMAIADYHSAVSSLANLRRVELDRFGYGTEDARNRQDRVEKTKAKMEALSARDYYQANPHRKPNNPVSGAALPRSL